MKFCPHCRKYVNTYTDELKTKRAITTIHYCENCNKWIETIEMPRVE